MKNDSSDSLCGNWMVPGIALRGEKKIQRFRLGNVK